MFKKYLALLIIAALIFGLFIEGCGKKAEETTEGSTEEGAEGGEENADVQEASRTAPAPAAAPPPAAAPAPAAAPKPPAPPKGGAPQQKQVAIKYKPVPEDRFLPIEFDTKEAALVTSGQTYGGKIRRNIFRDIKSSSKLRKDAESAIEQARKMVEKVKNMPQGTYSEPLFKQADENLKQADAAFKEQNYFKAKAVAEKAYELANEALPKADKNQDKPVAELLYKGFYQLSEEKTAMLTKKDADTGAEKLFMVQAGSIVSEELPNPVVIELPDGSQKKITKIEYKVEQITEDFLVITNITENKPSFNIAISRPGDSKTSGKDAKVKDVKEKEPAAADKPSFQSNQTQKTGSSLSGNKIGGIKK
ncbi:MAG TPA: DUF4398 domain-containing protein [Candidatus Wallbacteria bacterium]|nr:DUF4398 domain-containing protein [Candidatus Wallbacteria bacterium]